MASQIFFEKSLERPAFTSRAFYFCGINDMAEHFPSKSTK
jgi:hypothetical protein